MPAAMHALRRVIIETTRRYHRLEVVAREPFPDEPALVVANHGFGGVIDLNVIAVFDVMDRYAGPRAFIALTHQMAWTLGVGKVLEHLGARPASHGAALEAFASGQHVVVFPGGDLDAAKAFSDRNQVSFFGSSGFARLAIDADVPIVPVVTVGAGESLLVLTDGQSLAKTLRLKRLFRYRAMPVSVSVPWGVNVGMVGLLPYLPLPTKLKTEVLPAMRPLPDENAATFALRVEAAMQKSMSALTADRTPVLG